MALENHYELRLNCGLLIRGPAESISRFLSELDRILENHPEVHVVYRDTTDQKLWIRRGDGA